MRAVIGPLIDYNFWANRRVLDSVAALPGDAFTRELGREFSEPTLRRMLGHVMGAEILWLGRWRGLHPTALEPGDAYATPADLRARWEVAERDFRGFVEPLTDADLGRMVEYRSLDAREMHRSALWQMIQHVVNHGTHHRSEAATMLTRLGAPPPPLDLIVYYRSLPR
jgi:uncharacterized damage-inducible protein DinB